MEQETKTDPHIRIRLDVPNQPTVPAVTVTVPFDGVLVGDEYDFDTFTFLLNRIEFTVSHDQMASSLYMQYSLAMEAAIFTWVEALALLKREHDGEAGQ